MAKTSTKIGLLFGTVATALATLAAAEIPNVQISAPNPQLQNEEQIFYCPTDSNIVIANWREAVGYILFTAIGRSTDGGATWTTRLNNLKINEGSGQSDPTIAVDNDGNFYMMFLDFNQQLVFEDSSFLVLIKSTDKGETWWGPYLVDSAHGAWFEDKQHITTDRTGGPNDGNLYVAWSRFGWPNRVMFSRSTDGGLTFSDTLIIGPPIPDPPCENPKDGGHFAQPMVGPDGTVYVFWAERRWEDCDFTYVFDRILMNKSTDAGDTWLDSVQRIFDFDTCSQVDGAINVYTVPTGAIDISDGPYDGNIYISAMNGCQDGDIYHTDIIVLKSTDGGENWLPPIRVNDDPLGVDVDQFLPWLIVNEDGVVIVIWYDQRVDPNHYDFDVFAAYSFDGGETFTANHRLTAVSSSPDYLQKKVKDDRAGRIAEYIGVAAYHDNVNAAWTDTRNLNPDVFGAYYRIPFMMPRLYALADGGYLGPAPDSLLWSTCWHESDVSYRLDIDDDPLFASVDYSQSLSDNKLSLSSLSLTDGVYYWRIKAFRGSAGDSTDYSVVWSFEVDLQPPAAAVPVSPSGGEVVFDSLPTLSWSTDKGAAGAPEYFEIELAADSLFAGHLFYLLQDAIQQTHYTLSQPLPVETTYYWRVNHYDEAGNGSGFSPAASFTFARYTCGDADGNEIVNVSDAVYLVVYIFGGGPPPDPLIAGDVNCDEVVNISDAVYLISFIFGGGPEPCAACP